MSRSFYLFLFATQVLASDYFLLDQDYYDLDQADVIYKEFRRKYNKEPEIGREGVNRFEIFKNNLKKINEYNKKSGTNLNGVNQFTDLTFEEFSKCYLGFNGNSTNEDVVQYKPSGKTHPPTLDWRQQGYVTEVKNQQECGSCFAFSAIGNIEGQYAKTHGTQAFSLSNQQAFDCSSAPDCEIGGFPDEVFQVLATQGGSMRESDYPYENAKRQCRTDRSKIVVKVTGGSKLGIFSEQALQDALVNYGPLSIGICVNQEVLSYRGTGVFVPNSPCPNQNHAVLLVGYGRAGQNEFWLIKNSWGPGWGDQGYLHLIKDQQALTIGTYAASATVA